MLLYIIKNVCTDNDMFEKRSMDKTSPYDECNKYTFTCKDFSGFNLIKSILLGSNGVLYPTHLRHLQSPELP